MMTGKVWSGPRNAYLRESGNGFNSTYGGDCNDGKVGLDLGQGKGSTGGHVLIEVDKMSTSSLMLIPLSPSISNNSSMVSTT